MMPTRAQQIGFVLLLGALLIWVLVRLAGVT